MGPNRRTSLQQWHIAAILRRKGRTTAAAQAKPSPAVANAPSKGTGNGSAKMETGISQMDILTLKELVGRVTPSQLKTLIDAFAHGSA
jgi:hypothetical protein